MLERILALWRGKASLGQAFWSVTIVYGSLVNLIATGLMFAGLAAGLPSALAVAIHFLPLPYNVLALMSVWRSAGAYEGPPAYASMARLVAALWFALMIVL
ncbi:MAG TPA: hypothetical protein VIB38_04110 [Aestuariivirgaceae bacterium]|jgi:hypothetical protein